MVRTLFNLAEYTQKYRSVTPTTLWKAPLCSSRI